ncbi:autotransporter strand-loop-strand O-heptosyltransferase [Acetobacter indonesiensis]|uniref:autotransporter strand-loop-strand O-heptosyltransferase n=1 Tax=Acetobacter indonesiensis TaxID=104101 RepID=UPI001F01DCF6|nr:autotransporter strand-loop-strand O-heptosyltransferase [Acetobacter indonesiensis]MCG0995382.1 autotransporter strand-loop-strand O-heptosyltransferase [Acetobacter indonesiensis]MCP1230355.1 autotransporter strand-loop-strand O-heptosyltransferase [Acetobacter indonesiensis]
MTTDTEIKDPVVSAAPVESTVSSAPPAPPAPSNGSPAYLPPAEKPVLDGGNGVFFDFNLGARVLLPQRTEGKWRITLRDLDTGNILFQNENTGAFVSSAKRYYVRFGIEVVDISATGVETVVLEHEYDAKGKDVIIQLPVGTLGDTLAWFPYVARFAETYGARVTCLLSGLILPLLKDAYPNLRLMTSDDAAKEGICAQSYATYCIGLFFDDEANAQQPTDFRFVGLHRTAGYILGVSPQEEPPKMVLPDDTRPIPEPYVCIAVQASTQCKYWNNPTGWQEVITFLKQKGYRVICIDQKPVHGTGIVWNHIPHGVEDQTGNRPLAERARWLKHSEAFIGVSSGLAWLAWGAGARVVMVSGFTHPTNEFDTPYRVINWHTCNSCWNDPRVRFDHHNFLWCPRHENTPRQFECSRLITGQQVIGQLKKIVGE